VIDASDLNQLDGVPMRPALYLHAKILKLY
jgi:hypothetical protein